MTNAKASLGRKAAEEISGQDQHVAAAAREGFCGPRPVRGGVVSASRCQTVAEEAVPAWGKIGLLDFALEGLGPGLAERAGSVDKGVLRPREGPAPGILAEVYFVRSIVRSFMSLICSRRSMAARMSCLLASSHTLEARSWNLAA